MKKKNNFYVIKNNSVYDNKGSLIDNDEIKKIILKYPIPPFLYEVKLLVDNVKDADNNAVYLGKDEKNRIQYIYGINYEKNQSLKRINIFLKVEDKRKSIDNFINEQLNDKKKNAQITKEKLFALALLIEFTFYIKTGKRKQIYKDSTIGIIQTIKKNFIKHGDTIDIIFDSKPSKSQKFTLQKSLNPLTYEYINFLLSSTKKDTDNIFRYKNKNFTEKEMCRMLKLTFDLNLEDIRNYSVNRILIREFWKISNSDSYVNNLNKDNNKLISEVIKKTSDIIGHTPGVTKKCYILPELKTIFKKKIITANNFDDFYDNIVYILRNFNDYYLS